MMNPPSPAIARPFQHNLAAFGGHQGPLSSDNYLGASALIKANTSAISWLVSGASKPAGMRDCG